MMWELLRSSVILLSFCIFCFASFHLGLRLAEKGVFNDVVDRLTVYINNLKSAIRGRKE